MSKAMRESYGKHTRIASFDVFDTLVARVSGGARALFSCVEQRALSEGINVVGFADERVAAEQRALRAVGEANLKLKDIYSCFRGASYDGFLDKLMEMEEDAEVDLCVPIASGVELFQHCLESCEAVIVVSDMYLPKRVVARILDKCGITGYARLYVSCEYGMTKADGSLYERVVSDLGIHPSQITHYGDNLHSDVLSARRHGLNAAPLVSGRKITISKMLGRKTIDRVSPSRVTFLEVIGKSLTDGALVETTGYNVLGPLLVSFCEWLHRRRVACGLDGLWFAARDGLIMKRCYDLLYPGERTEYVYVSRRSTTVPMLHTSSNISGLAKSLGLGREMSIEEILMRLGLTEMQAENLRGNYGFSTAERLVVSTLEDDDRFIGLYGEAAPLIEKSSSEEFAAMTEYFKGSFGDARAVGFVDLGWRGSIQHAINEALPEMGLGNVCLRGLYLGVDIDSAWWDSQPMEGFLFSPGMDEALGVDERWFNALVEAFFMAPHGTVRRYVIDAAGRASVELEPREGGNDDSSPLFTAQRFALRFVHDYKERRWGEYGLLKKDEAIRALCRLGLEPTLAEAKTFGDCVFTYQEVSNLARPKHGLPHYFAHPRELSREVNLCYWKPAFLKRLAPLSVPYWRILALVKEAVAGSRARRRKHG